MIDYLNYGKQVHSIPKEPQSEIKICVPKTSHGWLEYKLNQTELNYVWSCVNDQEVKRNSWSHNLAGNIDGSFKLEDKNDWFFNNTLTPLINFYEQSFGKQSKRVPIFSKENNNYPPYCMETWWVNYQKQHEFNPPHNHEGLFSFVIWLKIPYSWKEQKKLPQFKGTKDNQKVAGSFYFDHLTMFGKPTTTLYPLDETMEGKMLFIPANLRHGVQPFYECDEKRVSISGNLDFLFQYEKA